MSVFKCCQDITNFSPGSDAPHPGYTLREAEDCGNVISGLPIRRSAGTLPTTRSQPL